MMLNTADRFSREKRAAHTGKTNLIANDLGLQPITILVQFHYCGTKKTDGLTLNTNKIYRNTTR
jgi:hypothetical protein